MTHTVIGLFDSKTEAETAMQELTKAGFAKEFIDFSNRLYEGEQTTSTTQSTGGTGGIGGFFSSLFDDDTTVQNYTSAASDAEAILTVQTDSDERARQIADILDRNGAIDVDERGSHHQANYAQSSGTTQNTATENRTGTTNRTETTGDMSIPVIQEDLQVGKRTVETGGVRVRSRVIEKPVEEVLRLREEHVVVNRHPVNREVTNADLSSFKEGEIELTERAEQAVVSKQARVVEEVEVGKQVSEREEVIHETVRSTDVDVEEINTDVRRATNK